MVFGGIGREVSSLFFCWSQTLWLFIADARIAKKRLNSDC